MWFWARHLTLVALCFSPGVWNQMGSGISFVGEKYYPSEHLVVRRLC